MFLDARRLKTIGALFFILIFIPGLFSARAEGPIPQYQVKAAFLFNFAKFVEWPAQVFESRDSPIVFGILGTDPFDGILEETIKNQKLNDRQIVIKQTLDFEEIKTCHLLFISQSEQDAAVEIIQRLKNTPVLTVSDIEDFTKNGGMIQFVHKETKIRFKINQDAAKNSNLKISSRLSSLAEPA